VAYAVWTVYAPSRCVGSGFFLRLPDGTIIGATAGHVLADTHYVPLHFRDSVNGATIAVFSRPAAPLRDWRNGGIVDDILLLYPDTVPAAEYVLATDPHTAMQPGERVTVLSGVSKPSNARRLRFAGTVGRVTADRVTVLMDDLPSPGQLSGSPVMNGRGEVWGMLTTCGWHADGVHIGVNPIGAVLAAAGR